MPASGKTTLEPRTFDIGSEHERFWCAAEGKRYAAAIGFDATSQGEIAICIAELASNVAKFAGRGTITLSMVEQPPGHPGVLGRGDRQGPLPTAGRHDVAAPRPSAAATT